MTSRTNRTRIKRRFLAAALFILLLATALRFYRLDAQSFWNDEGNSARLSERSLALILEGTASDIHPPLYYLLLRGWRELLGDSEFGLRALSAFAGVAVVALVVALGRVAYPGRGRPTALLAGLLAALSPALIYYSQEARMYALLALWAALSTLLLLRLPGRAYSHRLALAYVLTSAAGLYTHYFYPAVLLWQNILVLIHIGHEARSPHPLTSSPPHPSVPSPLRRLGHWAALMLLTLLLYLPWLPIFLRQAGGRPGDSTPLLDFGGAAVRFLALGPAGDAATLLPLLILAGFALLAALDWRRRPDVPGLAPWLGVLVPLLFMAVVGTTRPAYEKFLLAALPFFCLLPGRGLAVAWGWSAVLRPAGRRAAQLALLALGLLALIGPGRAFDQFPFITEQIVKVTIGPLCWRGSPGSFQTTGDCVPAISSAKAVFPAQSLLFQTCSFRFGTDMISRCCSMRLAESMSSRNQSHGFFIIHRHAGKCFSDILA